MFLYLEVSLKCMWNL